MRMRDVQRRKIIVAASVGTVAAVLVPLVLAAWLAYRFTFGEARDLVAQRANDLAANVSTVLNQVSSSLASADSLPLNCTPAVIQRLRELAFDLAEITEIGLMRPDGTLICSSWGPVDPPARFDIEPFDGELSLKGPITARMVSRLVLVAERRRPDGGLSNALLHPRTLVGVTARGTDRTSFIALVNVERDEALVAVGLVPTINGEPALEVSEAPFDDGIERLLARASVPGYPELVAVSAMTRSAVIDSLWRSTGTTIAGGLLVSLLFAGIILIVVRRRLSMRGELERAVHEQRLRVHYQPIIDVAGGRCIGVEALLRWQHERSSVRPDLFLPMAEEAGLIDEVTRLMLDRVVKDLSGILAANAHMHVAVNIPPEHLRSDWLARLVDQVVVKGPVEPRQIVLEFSERTLTTGDGQTTRRAIGTLTSSGVGLALDDFGAGYSSMAALQGIRLRYIKVDRHFVAAIGAEAASSKLVDAIVDMAGRLRVPVIAEGVETETQLSYLSRLGVESVQGFYYARPLTLRQLHQFLDEFEASWKPLGAIRAEGH